MQNNYPAAILQNFNGDYQRAYAYLSKVFLGMEHQCADWAESRFIEISRFEPDSPICVRKITEGEISRAVDMADCDAECVMRKWLYVDDQGELQPVTIGNKEPTNQDEECPFRYAASAIFANGVKVGTVVYTDH